jgi:hypothetical protein
LEGKEVVNDDWRECRAVHVAYFKAIFKHLSGETEIDHESE